MNITIKQLTLTNFKCFRHKEISFDGNITTISGRNGAGKTTIADAILWCLFGKNTSGQADFDLKTHDDNGKPIPNLDHSVEMQLDVMGEKDGFTTARHINLKRTLKETWIKKRGSDEQVFKNNTTEYLVNGEVYTAGDYKKFIAQLVDEDVFKAITSPTYFPSLKWQQQREFLTAMVGNISPEEVCGSDDELVKVFGALAEEGTDIIAYRKHLSYQVKQIKERLDKIPVRLEEQNKALPESLDYEALQMELDNVKKELETVNEKIIAFKSGNGSDVRKDEIRKQLDEKYELVRKEEQNMQQRVFTIQREHNEKVAELSNKFNTLLSTQRDIETQISSLDTLANRCKETAESDFKHEQDDIRAKWPLTQAKFNVEEDGVCELCGQILPADKLEKAKEDFNIKTALFKQKLTERATKAKELLAEAEKQAKEYEEKKAEAEKNLADIKEQINQVFSEKQKVERDKETIPTYEFLKESNIGYQAFLKQIANLESELQSSTSCSDDDTKDVDDLNVMKCSLTEGIQNLTAQLATRDMRLKILALIDGINEEQKDLVRQLSELERKEDVARRYQDRQNAILESRINEHFKVVQWKMFRTVNNGGDPFDEPYCECYVDGVAYHDGLNQAARLNAGLDIINTLCKHYNVSAPIVLDNAESTINIIETIGQQIRLQVADTNLQII